MPINPTFVQSQIASSDASVWTPISSEQETQLTVTLNGVTAGNIVQVIVALFCDAASLGAVVNTASVAFDSLGQAWATTNGPGLDRTSGPVGAIWNASWALLDTSGDTTITAVITALTPPTTPYLAVAVAMEYAIPLGTEGGVDGGLALQSDTSPISVGALGSDNSVAIVLGVAVNDTSDVAVSGGGFSTRQSATGLPNSSSVVLADLVTTNGTCDLTSSGSGSFNIGGFGNDIFLVLSPPTCALVTTSVVDDGLPPWQPNFNYDPINTDDIYFTIIRDSNGNLQYATTGGVSGATEPTWGTAIGDITTDGAVTWVRAALYADASWVNELPNPIFTKLGSDVTLTWTSTGADTASISGGVGTVAVNGSTTTQPTAGMVGEYVNPVIAGSDIWIGAPSVFVQKVYGAAGYTLSVSGPGGSATASVPLVILTAFDSYVVQSFAPVNEALASPQGECAAEFPVAPPLVRWGPNIPYNQGAQVLDSNGMGQIALAPGFSGATEPTWAIPGNDTTETTGLTWQNFGQIYPGFLTQRGFGPGWSGYCVLGFGFDEMVMPRNIAEITPYATGHTYSFGDVVYPASFSTFGNFIPGLPILRCIVAGVSGPSIPEFPVQGSTIIGQAIPDASLSGGFGSTLVWQNVGPLVIYLQWQGTTIQAPSGYGPPVELGTSTIPAVFDGTVQTVGMVMNRTLEFLTDPASFNPTISPQDTTPIPGDPVFWVSTFLGTGYINPAASLGFTHNLSGCWAIFSVPLSFVADLGGNGSITVVKKTIPADAPDVFEFLPSWGAGDPFTLGSNESIGSGPIPPGVYSVTETPTPGWFITSDLDPTNITVAAGQTVIITFTNIHASPIPAQLLPFLIIPSGQGQSVNELDGQTSISTIDVECVDPSNVLKYLATKPEVIGMQVYLKMGFEGMKLSDFVPLHTMQIADLGRSTDGIMRFSCRDSLSLLDRALWYCGGPQPVALPWLYGQRYEVGQYVQDTNGNIQQCIIAGTTSNTQPPIWPGTPAPPWQPNTSYTLGFWATDINGNLVQVTTVPSGSTSTRPLNTGQSGDGFPNPSWTSTLGAPTLDNSGGSSNGPITWTLIAINDLLGIQVVDNTVTWEIVAKPYQGAFGGSQAFYVYSLYGQTIQTPEPPLRTAFTSNYYPTVDGNPRYIYGNPLDAMLVALQNELGLGQNPLLPPIVTTDPNNPQNALVFAPNPDWQQYIPGNDATLINPNPFVRVGNILAIRDSEMSGRKFEWAIKRPVTAKSWIQDEILKPLGLYMFTHNDGSIDIKSMKSPEVLAPVSMDSSTIDGIPDQGRIPIVNVMTVRGDVDDEGAYSAARVYDAEMTFVQQTSLATYQQEFANSVESNGMREAYDSYGVGYLLANRVFRRHAFATPEYTIKTNLGWTRLEVGDYILLTHPLMLDYTSTSGQVGIYNVLCEIVDRQPDYQNGTITLKVWDTRFMQLSKPFDIAPLADSIPDWDAMTDDQKAKYMAISYWPGWYSDGTSGDVIF